MTNSVTKDDAIITSGRFQPLHMGHIELWEQVKQRFPDNLLVVCVMRNPHLLHRREVRVSEDFLKLSIWTHAKERNPLPNWERFHLVSIAIKSNQALRDSTEVILREKPELNWSKSLEDLPTRRVWVFNPDKSPFDKSKVDFYRANGEKVVEISFAAGKFSATEIRSRLRQGATDLDFLPVYCHEYFKSNCLIYFQGNSERENND